MAKGGNVKVTQLIYVQEHIKWALQNIDSINICIKEWNTPNRINISWLSLFLFLFLPWPQEIS